MRIEEPNQPITEHAWGELLAASSNHEAKAITLGMMELGKAYNARELYSNMKSKLSDDEWMVRKSVLHSYCIYSFAPAGLVVKADYDVGEWSGFFSKTKYAADVADGLNGHLLTFSLNYPQLSLIDLFGRKNVPEQAAVALRHQMSNITVTRSPWRRYKLYRSLVRSRESRRITDLIDDVPSVSNMEKVLFQLSNKGIISYESSDTNTNYVLYKNLTVPPNAPFPSASNHLQTLMSRIINILPEFNDSYHSKDVLDALTRKYPQMNDLNQTSLRNNISEILSQLSREHYVIKSYFSNTTQSRISLNLKQRDMLSHLVSIVNRAVDQDREFLVQGRQLMDEIINDPDRLSMLLGKAKLHSPNANRIDKEVAEAQVLDIMDGQQIMSSRQIQLQLKDIHHRDLTISTINAILKHLREKQRICFEKRGSQYYYRSAAMK